jgi:hypothetical protein
MTAAEFGKIIVFKHKLKTGESKAKISIDWKWWNWFVKKSSTFLSGTAIFLKWKTQRQTNWKDGRVIRPLSHARGLLCSDSNTGGAMRHRILHLMCLITCVVVLLNAAYAQQSHWATPDDNHRRKPTNLRVRVEHPTLKSPRARF